MRLRAVLRERAYCDFSCSVLVAVLRRVVFMEGAFRETFRGAGRGTLRQEWQGAALWNTRRAEALSRQRSPSIVAAQVLPQALKAPDHVQLPVGEMLEKAVGQ